jgi:hypothetical protein
MNLRRITLGNRSQSKKAYVVCCAITFLQNSRKCKLIHRESKQMSGYLGTGRREEWDYQGVRKRWRLTEMSVTLTLVLVSHVHASPELTKLSI